MYNWILCWRNVILGGERKLHLPRAVGPLIVIKQ
jgi:hypothetical protein